MIWSVCCGKSVVLFKVRTHGAKRKTFLIYLSTIFIWSCRSGHHPMMKCGPWTSKCSGFAQDVAVCNKAVRMCECVYVCAWCVCLFVCLCVYIRRCVLRVYGHVYTELCFIGLLWTVFCLLTECCFATQAKQRSSWYICHINSRISTLLLKRYSLSIDEVLMSHS